MEIKNVVVVGAGLMGSGIGYVIANAGINVKLVDIKEEYVKAGISRIKQDVKDGITRGKMSPQEGMKLIERLSSSTDLAEAAKGADLVIEAVFESMEVKKQVFKTLSDNAREDAILATNTSTLSITKIAEGMKNPSRIIGMHFFSPVAAMKLVEVISGKETSEGVRDQLMDFSKKIGKSPIAAKDSPGFLVNRLLLPMLNEAIKAYEHGEASKELIDDVAAGQAHFPAGPFLLADNVGLDVAFHAMKTLEENFGPCYKPGKPLADLVEAGKLGMKTREGFYNYATKDKEGGSTEGSFNILRILAPMFNEAFKLLDEGVAEPDDIDNAAMLGARFPAGPFALTEKYGADKVVAMLKELQEKYGDCYKVANSLLKKVE